MVLQKIVRAGNRHRAMEIQNAADLFHSGNFEKAPSLSCRQQDHEFFSGLQTKAACCQTSLTMKMNIQSRFAHSRWFYTAAYPPSKHFHKHPCTRDHRN